MAKRMEPSASSPRASKKAANEGRGGREVEDAPRLDKLPPEVWERIFDELDENDLFPLALSCRFFREKQKELVARSSQSGPESEKSRLALKTTLRERNGLDWTGKAVNRHPASADYLRFCSKEEVPSDSVGDRDRRIRILAAYRGHLPLLQELLKPFSELESGIVDNAAEGGQLETLQWLKTQKGFPVLDSSFFATACDGGNLEVLKWLRSEGCPWDTFAGNQAALGGHLEILKWLRKAGCPWDAGVFANAAIRGSHLEVFQWCCETHPCYAGPISEEALKRLGFA